jgi:hypothetical protein
MSEGFYRGRRASAIENSQLRVTVLHEGGHIAEIFDKRAGVNPLWTPPWPSLEPSAFETGRPQEYGGGTDAKLLAGIMGHNLCLDIFGGPSNEEAAAGLTAHGEGSIAPYEISSSDSTLNARARLPLAQLYVERQIELTESAVRIRETVENSSACDRPVGWTQHVTLGPPFLEKGITQFRASATRSKVFETAFGVADYLRPSAEFDWPMAPRVDGGVADLRILNGAPRSSAYTAHLMDPQQEHAFFVAFSPSLEVAFGYVWRRNDFPWMGIWEENLSRTHAPWNGQAIARGMEFGVSPIPESRRSMIDRGRLFGAPTYRWIPAMSKLQVEYWIVCLRARAIPESLALPAIAHR